MPGGPGDEFMAQIAKELHDHFGEHPTIQIELGNPANFVMFVSWLQIATSEELVLQDILSIHSHF